MCVLDTALTNAHVTYGEVYRSGYARRVCGRYAQTASMDLIVEEFSIDGSLPHDPLPINWNIAPTNPIYIIKAEHHNDLLRRSLDIASWGIMAPWEKDFAQAKASQSRAINARSESVHEKPTFRDSFRHRRCLIPATGYYEWATALGKYKTKQPFYIHRNDNHQISFAGIYSTWHTQHGEIIQSAAVITRDAVGELETIHDRMPVMLPRAKWNSWLDPDVKEVEEIRGIMNFDISHGERPDEGLTAYPVSTRVNSVSNNGPSIIERLELGEPETLF